MTDTVISSHRKEVVIGFNRPFCLIGERINPTGRKLLAAEMKVGDYSRVETDALAQVAAGANVLVSGSALYKYQEGLEHGVEDLRRIATEAQVG